MEDAGVVEFGTDRRRRWGIIMAHESHNHPSQVMPFEGAATGIGGIVRDVYCMGGEVVGTLDPLRFGWPEQERPTTTAPQPSTSRARSSPGSGSTATPWGCPNLGGDVYFHHSASTTTAW